LQDGDLLRYW